MASGLQDRAASHVRSAREHARVGSLVDAAADLDRALAFGDACPDRTTVLVEASQARMMLGEPTRAEELAKTAFAEATSAHDEPVAMAALGVLGQLHKRRGDFASALRIARDGRGRAVRLGNRAEEFTFTLDESFALEGLGDMDGALRSAYEAQDVARRIPDPAVELKAMGRLGALLRETGRTDDAYPTAVDGVRRARELGNRREEAHFFTDLGLVLLGREEPAEAVEAFGNAFVLLVETGEWEYATRLVTEILVRCTDPRDARVVWLAARAGTLVTLSCGDELGPAVERLALRAVLAALRLGSRADAEVHLEEIREQLEEAAEDPARRVPAPLLSVALELIVMWFCGERVAQHMDLARSLDEALGGGHELADLLTTSP